jgi:hypothetical protein
VDLSAAARRMWEMARARWATQQAEPEPDDVIEALRKADAQCYRIALVIAESVSPGAGTEVSPEEMQCAVALVDYAIGCWRAIPGGKTMAASRADDVMDAVSLRFLAWLESRPAGTEGLPPGAAPRPRAKRRDIQLWMHLKADKLTALILEHEARYPGCVVSVGARAEAGKGKSGGRPTVYVYAPERKKFDVAATPKPGISSALPEDKEAGENVADSVLRVATPNPQHRTPARAPDAVSR